MARSLTILQRNSIKVSPTTHSRQALIATSTRQQRNNAMNGYHHMKTGAKGSWKGHRRYFNSFFDATPRINSPIAQSGQALDATSARQQRENLMRGDHLIQASAKGSWKTGTMTVALNRFFEAFPMKKTKNKSKNTRKSMATQGVQACVNRSMPTRRLSSVKVQLTDTLVFNSKNQIHVTLSLGLCS